MNYDTRLGLEPDYCTQEGAEGLVKALTAYWTAKGYTTHKFWVEGAKEPSKSLHMRHSMWVVRCNLINGLPPKMKKD
jgi:hypothetical protein